LALGDIGEEGAKEARVGVGAVAIVVPGGSRRGPQKKRRGVVVSENKTLSERSRGSKNP